VGNVTDVLLPQAFLDGVKAHQGDSIRARQTLSTDDGGAADFSLNQKISSCRLLESSAVQIQPAGALLAFVRGTTYCWTTADQQLHKVTAGSAQLIMSDPVFGVTVQGGQVVIKVDVGVIKVSSPQTNTGVSLVIGPGQFTVVPAGQNPQSPGRISDLNLPEEEMRVATAYSSLPPPPFLGRPDAGSSALLARVFARGHLLAGVDQNTLAEGTPERDFVSRFLRFLGRHWKDSSGHELGVDEVSLAPEDAPAALKEDKIDLFVSTERGATPLFVDLQGRIFKLAVAMGDQGFRQAIRVFLQGDVQGGTYDNRYRSVFDGENPNYGPLASVLGFG